MLPDHPQFWQVKDRFLELHSRWLTLIGEHWIDDQGQPLEYWRVEKADSVIVLPIVKHDTSDITSYEIILPSVSYRPGIRTLTLDFPGGRVLSGQTPTEAATATIMRELAIPSTSITQLIPLNTKGWAVNSSFSNQKLYGFVAYLHVSHPFPKGVVVYPVNSSSIHKLLGDLNCLQCRAVLLEWYYLECAMHLDG